MSDQTPAGGTILTPAALFQLRGELDVLRQRIEGDRQKVVALERRVEDLVAGVNEQDRRFDDIEHRVDGIDTRLVVTETINDRLLAAVTTSSLLAERTEKHMLAMMRHLKIPEVA